MDAAGEIRRNPANKDQVQPEYEDAQVDAGLDCRTRLARPNSQGRMGTTGKLIFPVQLTTSKIDNLTRSVHVCMFVVIHVRFVGRTSRSHTGGRSHKISAPSFCGACFIFSREKDSVVPFPRRP